MLFNSIPFLLFLPIVFFLHWFVLRKSLNNQNRLLLFSSYIFYAWWDFRFLFLLIFSTALDYFSAIAIEKSANQFRRKTWLIISLTINLGFLAVFKYYDFFVSSFNDALNQVGVNCNLELLSLVLPVGISFYTFHGISYLVDIYNNRIQSERNWTQYALFVSYFPLLVAGPIERATHLLPQIKRPRIFNSEFAMSGFRWVLWGFFKKIAIADNIAPSVNEIFSNYSLHNSGTLLLGAVLFSIQIYCDFSGYSDIARGISRFFGIELLTNFNSPYFSRSIPEFWKKWHISLSSWFRDYVYIPLGGSRVNQIITIRNVFVIFLLSGFWHGANWTYIFWGLLHAVLFLPSVVLQSSIFNWKTNSNFSVSIKNFVQVLATFFTVTIAWIFFRSPNISSALRYIRRLTANPIDLSFLSYLNPYDNQIIFKEYIFILILFIGEFLYIRFSESGFFRTRWFNYLFCVVTLILVILSTPINSANSFIYFQF